MAGKGKGDPEGLGCMSLLLLWLFGGVARSGSWKYVFVTDSQERVFMVLMATFLLSLVAYWIVMRGGR